MLESLRVQNIRSHASTSVDFKDGITLIEGDVGSGKSTLLKAVQFALFGAGDERSLLRYGENVGSVDLRFSVSGRRYAVHRELRRVGDKVRSAKGYWEEDGMVTPLSSSQLNEKVMDALGIRASERARKLPIWEYAFYTSQEKLKAILSDRDARKKAVGAAFNTEKYARAASNAQRLAANLLGEAENFESYSSDLEEKEMRMKEKTAKLEELAARVDGLSSRLQEAKEKKERAWADYVQKGEELKHLDSLISDLKTKKEKYAAQEGGLLKRVQDKEKRLREDEEQLKRVEEELSKPVPPHRSPSDVSKDLDAIANEIQAESNRLFALGEMKKQCQKLQADLQAYSVPAHRPASAVEADLSSANDELLKAQSRLNQLSDLLQKYEEMEKEGKCPCCGRDASPEFVQSLRVEPLHEISALKERIPSLEEEVNNLRLELRKAYKLDEMENVRREKEKELRDSLQRLSQLFGEEAVMIGGDPLKAADEVVGLIEKRLDYLKDEQQRLQQELRDSVEAEKRDQLLQDLVSQRARLQASISSAKQEIDEIQAELEALRREEAGIEDQLSSSLEDRQRAYSDYDKAEKAYRGADEEYGKINAEYQATLSTRASLQNEIVELQKEVEDKREARGRGKELRSLSDWVRQEFIPVLGEIEKEVLARLNQEFQDKFSEFFSLLVDDPQKRVRVDEDFSPIIEHGGIEMDIDEGPSGGERSSIALAYRLALNDVAREVAGLSVELMLLDEPTDGFSSEQLSKFRDLVANLRARQIILVSHEKELENAADHVLLITKENDESVVQQIRSRWVR